MAHERGSDLEFYLHALLSVLSLVVLCRIMIPPASASERVHVAPLPITTSSYVWNDLNGNGVRDPGDPPVPGVRINVYAIGQDKEIGSGYSDGQGRCELTFYGVPGRYRLRFEPPAGYTFTQAKRGRDARLDSKAGPDGTTAPFLGQGLVEHLDAGLLKQEAAPSFHADSTSGKGAASAL